MKYLSFSVPGGNLDNPTGIPIDPVGGMPNGGVSAVSTISTLTQAIITDLFIITTLLALFFLIFGGIQWIISGGDKTKVEAARKKITFAIIGLVLAFSAFLIINTVGALFGVNLLDTPVPRSACSDEHHNGYCTDTKKACRLQDDGHYRCSCNPRDPGCAS
jgi:hypothetical protein